MLILLILFAALNLSSSIPITAQGAKNDHEPIMVLDCQFPECMNAAHYRTIQRIVLSCLATIFACTWVVIHPNLPGPSDYGRTKLMRKIVMAIYAVLSPELLAMWALRQRMAAGRIALQFNMRHHGAGAPSPIPWYLTIRGAPSVCWTVLSGAAVGWWRGPERDAPGPWTLTHGFFVQMGGFMLCEGKKPIRVLTFDDLLEMIDEGLVEVPDVTEKYINDKSKGDFLSKLVVILQTTWFSFQCIARWSTDLPVTELEVATLAFAALNVVTYGLWWKKPQSIEVAVRVQLKSRVTDTNNGKNEAGEIIAPWRLSHGGYEKKVSWITGWLRDAVSKGWAGWLFEIPAVLFLALRRPIVKMVSTDDLNVPHGSLRIPMFYADRHEKHDTIPIMVLAVFFGSFHLISWSSVFPSPAERWLWCSSALLITTHPLLLVGNIVAKSRLASIDSALAWAFFAVLPLYYLARLVLLTLAFTTLRALPKEAYMALEWTTFIPHL